MIIALEGLTVENEEGNNPLVPQEGNKAIIHHATASRSTDLGPKDSLRKWASSQPAGNKISNYCVPCPKAPAKNKKIGNKAHGSGAAVQ